MAFDYWQGERNYWSDPWPKQTVVICNFCGGNHPDHECMNNNYHFGQNPNVGYGSYRYDFHNANHFGNNNYNGEWGSYGQNFVYDNNYVAPSPDYYPPHEEEPTWESLKETFYLFAKDVDERLAKIKDLIQVVAESREREQQEIMANEEYLNSIVPNEGLRTREEEEKHAENQAIFNCFSNYSFDVENRYEDSQEIINEEEVLEEIRAFILVPENPQTLNPIEELLPQVDKEEEVVKIEQCMDNPFIAAQKVEPKATELLDYYLVRSSTLFVIPKRSMDIFKVSPIEVVKLMKDKASSSLEEMGKKREVFKNLWVPKKKRRKK